MDPRGEDFGDSEEGGFTLRSGDYRGLPKQLNHIGRRERRQRSREKKRRTRSPLRVAPALPLRPPKSARVATPPSQAAASSGDRIPTTPLRPTTPSQLSLVPDPLCHPLDRPPAGNSRIQVFVDWYKVLKTNSGPYGVPHSCRQAFQRLLDEPGILPGVISFVGAQSFDTIQEVEEGFRAFADGLGFRGIALTSVPTKRALCAIVVHEKRYKLNFTHIDRVGRPTKGRVLQDFPEAILLDDSIENVCDCLLRGIPAIQIQVPPRDDTPHGFQRLRAPQDLVKLRAREAACGRATHQQVAEFDFFSPQASFPGAVDFLISQYRENQPLAEFYLSCGEIPGCVRQGELVLDEYQQQRSRSA